MDKYIFTNPLSDISSTWPLSFDQWLSNSALQASVVPELVHSTTVVHFTL